MTCRTINSYTQTHTLRHTYTHTSLHILFSNRIKAKKICRGVHRVTDLEKFPVQISKMKLGDSNWKFFQVSYPVDTPTDVNLLLRVSVTHHPALPRSILGRWKEQSSDETSVLANCTRNIQTDQRIRNTF